MKTSNTKTYYSDLTFMELIDINGGSDYSKGKEIGNFLRDVAEAIITIVTLKGLK